jgi:hypothetical protein
MIRVQLRAKTNDFRRPCQKIKQTQKGELVMKKGFIIGMLALSATVAFSTAHAAGATGAKAPREALADYTKTVKEHFAKMGANKGVNSQNRSNIEKIVEQDLGLSGAKKAALLTSLTGSDAAVSARMEGLASIVAAKKMSADIAKTDKAEADSIQAAAEASAKMLANSSLVGSTKEVATLKGEELTSVRQGLSKIETLAGDILVKFSKAERDSYTKVLEKYDELAETGTKGSAEEAFVQAIMDVKKVDRAKALETVRKLKECV